MVDIKGWEDTEAVTSVGGWVGFWTVVGWAEGGVWSREGAG